MKSQLLTQKGRGEDPPEEIIKRRKLGLSTPAAALFRGGFRDVCDAAFRTRREVLERYFSPAGLRSLSGSIGAGILSIPEQKLFQIYLFILWHGLFIDRKAQRDGTKGVEGFGRL